MPDSTKQSNAPELDVNKIIARIREEVARRRSRRPSGTDVVDEAAGDAQSSTGRNPSIDTSSLWSTISSAEAHADVGTEVTPMLQFRGLTRQLALFIGKKIVYLSSFITFKQRNFNRAVVQALKTITDGLERLSSGELGRLVEIGAGTKKDIEGLRNEQAEVKELLTKQIELLRNEQQEARSALEKTMEASRDELTEIRSLMDHMRSDLAETHTSLQAGKGYQAETVTALKETVNKEQFNEILKQVGHLKLNILDQQRRLTLLLEEVRQQLPAPMAPEQVRSLLKEEDHVLDAMYVAFEDQFRGTREDIKERQRVYLSYIEGAAAEKGNALVLDVGCGRGEWLELLKENGYTARGVDINGVMIEQCRESGFDVMKSDIIQYLRNQEANTFGAVTGFHVIEHLRLNALVMLLDESFRVLRPGGVVIFETPNPENLVVGASSFYIDPTHQRPLFPAFAKFLLESRGFVRTEVLRLHKRGEPDYTGEKFIDEMLYFINREQDYSVIGYKA